MVHLAPGDPASLYLQPGIDPKTVELIRRQMGLDLPIWRQYLNWIYEFSTGNFGISFLSHRPVIEILKEALPNTLQLTLIAFLVQLVLGILIGVSSALKQGSAFDNFLNGGLLLLYSLPGYWLALVAILIFSLQLGWLPSSQMASLTLEGGFWVVLKDRILHLILPVSVLATSLTAYTARFVRGSLTDVLAQNYIRTAIAYGLKRRQIVFKYALKNALLPVATLIGLHLPFLLGGAVIIEYIFAWPGMGRLTVNAIFAHDYPVIMASGFIAAVSVVLGNFISDVLYMIIDPRIKTGG